MTDYTGRTFRINDGIPYTQHLQGQTFQVVRQMKLGNWKLFSGRNIIFAWAEQIEQDFTEVEN